MFFYLNLSAGNFWEIAYPHKSFASKCIKNDDYLPLLYSFMYLLFAFAYLCIYMTYSSSNTNNISVSVKNSNSISVFLNMFAMLIHLLIKNEQDQNHMFQYIYFIIKFSNKSASNNVSLWTYKSWYSPRFFILKSFHTPFACL